MRDQFEQPCYTPFSDHPAKQLDQHVSDFVGGLMGQERKQPVAGENEVFLPALTLGDSADQADRIVVPRGSSEEIAYNTAREATVQLSTGYSGFFLDGQGTFITASNAIPHGQIEGVAVKTADGKELKAGLIARDESNNLAVLRVEGSSEWFPNLTVSRSHAYNHNLGAVGHPQSWPDTYISFGKADGKPFEKEFPVIGYDRAFEEMGPLLKMDAHTTSGSTGGPVIDGCGTVRGMVVGRTLNGYGAVTSTLAVPGETINNFLSQAGVFISPYDTGRGWDRSSPQSGVNRYRDRPYYDRGDRPFTKF